MLQISSFLKPIKRQLKAIEKKKLDENSYIENNKLAI